MGAPEPAAVLDDAAGMRALAASGAHQVRIASISAPASYMCFDNAVSGILPGWRNAKLHGTHAAHVPLSPSIAAHPQSVAFPFPVNCLRAPLPVRTMCTAITQVLCVGWQHFLAIVAEHALQAQPALPLRPLGAGEPRALSSAGGVPREVRQQHTSVPSIISCCSHLSFVTAHAGLPLRKPLQHMHCR